jgi:hypothetical protein
MAAVASGTSTPPLSRRDTRNLPTGVSGDEETVREPHCLDSAWRTSGAGGASWLVSATRRPTDLRIGRVPRELRNGVLYGQV